jgi:hypothetical protein
MCSVTPHLGVDPCVLWLCRKLGGGSDKRLECRKINEIHQLIHLISVTSNVGGDNYPLRLKNLFYSDQPIYESPTWGNPFQILLHLGGGI